MEDNVDGPTYLIMVLVCGVKLQLLLFVHTNAALFSLLTHSLVELHFLFEKCFLSGKVSSGLFLVLWLL